MGHVSPSFRLFLGTLSRSIKNVSETPLTSFGGASALSIKLCIIISSKSLECSDSWPPSPPRIMLNAFAKVLYAAATSPGKGREFSFCGLRSPDVSTRSRVVKKVERSGRRGGAASGFECLMLCSTVGLSVFLQKSEFASHTFVACHYEMP